MLGPNFGSRQIAHGSQTFCTTIAFVFGRELFKAKLPAVVSIPSPGWVAILSYWGEQHSITGWALLTFIRIGIPCRGLRTRPAARSSSSRSASFIATGLIARTALRYSSCFRTCAIDCWTRSVLLNAPELRPSWSWDTVAVNGFNNWFRDELRAGRCDELFPLALGMMRHVSMIVITNTRTIMIIEGRRHLS
jgi:hypothetical protein